MSQIGQIIPITFYLVITRASMIRIRGDEKNIALSEPRFAGRSAWTSDTHSGPGSDSKPVEVRISRFVAKDGDSGSMERRRSKERGSESV